MSFLDARDGTACLAHLLDIALRDLVDRAQFTADDIALLHHEAGGNSKTTAAAMNTEAKTIDCRFQRVSNKLFAPSASERRS